MRILFAACLSISLVGSIAGADEKKEKEVNKKVKEVAGVAEFLRSVPKHFATLQSVDAARRRVTLLVEGDKFAKSWDLAPDAEVKVMGWWGRLDQFTVGDRVWVWFQTDRQKQVTGILMLADELSEQDIHQTVWKISASTTDSVTFHPDKGADRTMKVAPPTPSPAKSDWVRFQSAGEKLRLMYDQPAFEKARETQKAALRQRWEKEGLPGSVLFLHPLSGEMEVMLDHEAMRWGRALQLGDEVHITLMPPMKAIVREVRPWRERTQVRLVAAAADQGDLRPGQRINLKMKPPPSAVDAAQLPPDIGKRTGKQERIDWFLASVYCTCLVRNNTCTGHFYTLASCNPNGCGQPALVKKQLAEMIDKGMTDEQIFAALLKEHGPGLLKPHLLP